MKARKMIQRQTSLQVEKTKAMAMSRSQVLAIQKASALSKVKNKNGSLQSNARLHVGRSSIVGRSSMLSQFPFDPTHDDDEENNAEDAVVATRTNSLRGESVVNTTSTAGDSPDANHERVSSNLSGESLDSSKNHSHRRNVHADINGGVDINDMVVGVHDCHKCGLRMEGDKLIFALNKYWCLENCTCFTCVVCAKVPPNLTYFEHQDQIYCADDYLNSEHGAHLCGTCFQPISLDVNQDSIQGGISLMGRVYHRECLRCTGCSRHLLDHDDNNRTEGEKDGKDDIVRSVHKKPFCSKCYHEMYRTCPKCHLDPGPHR